MPSTNKLARFPRGATARLVLLAIILQTFLVDAWGQLKTPEKGLVRSFSGQFTGRALAAPAAYPKSVATNQDLVRLEPTLVAVSCERIKQLLYRELNANAPWR